MPNLRSWIVLAFLLLPFCGCSQESDGLHAVSGTVNVDGAPVQTGSIRFEPTEGQASFSGSMIINGKYTVPRDTGLLPGKYRVAITAPLPGTVDKSSSQALPGEAPPLAKDLIPPEWNSASTQFIEVKKGGSNVFPFEIATKGGAKSK
jgi:hypothetical protein